jgi:hypothetical protein
MFFQLTAVDLAIKGNRVVKDKPYMHTLPAAAPVTVQQSA